MDYLLAYSNILRLTDGDISSAGHYAQYFYVRFDYRPVVGPWSLTEWAISATLQQRTGDLDTSANRRQ